MPRNPLDVLAQQLVAMTVMDRSTVAELLATVTRAAPFETPVARGPRGRDRHARRRLPLGRVRRAEVAGRVGPRHRRRRGAAGRPGGGGDIGRDDPGPGAVRRLPRRGGRDAGPAGRRARRGDGLRAPGGDARGRRRPRREQLAHPRHHARPRDRGARAGGSRQAAVLEGRRHRPADRARPGDRRVRPRGRGRPGPRPEGPGAGRRAAAGEPRPRRARRGEPARLPGGGARGRRDAADRPADRRRAVPRRARRLAARDPDAVRRPDPRAVDAGHRGAPPRAPRHRGPDDLVG